MIKKTFLLLCIVFASLVIFKGRGFSYYSCSLQLGVGAIDNFNGTCSCSRGYRLEKDIFGGAKCESMYTVCSEELGFMGSYNSLSNSCECNYGYTLGKDIFGDLQCISLDKSCENSFGIHANSSSSSTCSCDSGYEFGINSYGDKECMSCSSKHGLYSSYDYLAKSCTCMDGYTFGDDGQCVKKQNNVYFLLREIDTDNYKAIIYNDYLKKNYLISYGLGCISIRRYENKLLVVNLGTDLSFDTRDKIVLQDDDQSCSVITKEVVDDNYTLKSYIDIFGDHAIDIGNDKCSCSQGYTFNSAKTECVSSTYAPTTYTNYNELSTAVLWMYNNGLTSYSTVEKYRGSDFITREQASKIFVKFSNTLGKYDNDKLESPYIDIKDADKTLIPYIGNAYSMGIIKGKNGNFMPFNNLTQAQALAIIIRISNGLQTENGSEWYSEYYSIANNYGILDGLGFSYTWADSINITRQDIALLLYRLYNNIK